MKLIPDEHYIHTDTVTNHHHILLLAFVSKQFILKRLLLLCYPLAFSELIDLDKNPALSVVPS